MDYFGTSEIKSQTIPRGIVAPYHPSNIEMTSYSHTLSILHFIYWLRKWKRCPSISLSPSEIIYRCATAQASIPSDKVHALCALFEVYHINRPVFPICYQLSASDVYQHFTVWCVNQELNLDILARKSIFTGRSHVSMIDLPTWAVDWTSLTISRMQLMEGLMTNDECFSSPYSPSLERMGRQLRVRGLLIDCLESLLGNCLTDASLEEWQALIPDDRENNSLLLEEESPKLTTLRYIFEETSSSDYDIPYLWQQGHSSYGPGGTRTSFRTGRGCVARADEHLADYDDVKICALYGGRSLFLLEPVTDAGLEGTYRLLAGDCYIKGFEDGKGIDMAHNLGLEETDFILI